jgi:hypothetical protein
MDRATVQAAYETVKKLGSYFDEANTSFENSRWAAMAEKKLGSFLKRRTDLVSGGVIATVEEINAFQTRLAAADFNYDAVVDETSPNAMFDGPEPIFDEIKADKDVTKELGNDDNMVAPTPKQAGSELLDGVSTGTTGTGPWADFSTEALTGMIKTLSSDSDFGTDKASQKAVAEMSKVLSERSAPMPEEEPKQAKVKSPALRALHVAAGEEDMTADSDKGNLQNDSIDDNLKKAEVDADVSAEAPQGKLKPFTKEDWYGLAGAERFDDGSEPLIATFKVTNWPNLDPAAGGEVTMTVDKEGIQILDWGDGFFFRDMPSKEESIKLAESILAHEPVDAHDLLQRGFTPQFSDDVQAQFEQDAEGKITKGEIERGLGRQSSKEASEAEVEQAETTEDGVSKLVKFLDGFDHSELGGTQEVERVKSLIFDLKTQAQEALKATVSQVEALSEANKTVEEKEKDMTKSSKKLSPSLRGLRVASFE